MLPAISSASQGQKIAPAEKGITLFIVDSKTPG